MNDQNRSKKQLIEELVLLRQELIEKEQFYQSKLESTVDAGEEIFRSFAEESPLGIIASDIKGKISFINPSMIEILGSPSNEQRKLINIMRFQPLIEAGVTKQIGHSIVRKMKTTIEIPYASKCNKLIFLRLHITPLFDIQELPIGILILCEDITERRNTEKALIQSRANLEKMIKMRTDEVLNTTNKLITEISEREEVQKRLRTSEDNFRRIVEQASDGVIVINFDGKILDINLKICNMLGYKRDEFLQLSVLTIGTNYSIDALKNIRSVLKKNGSMTLESIYKRKDHSKLPVEVSVGLIQSASEEIILLLIRDITLRKTIERERDILISKLERQNHELEQYAYTVSHDLKSPLITIQGFVKHLLNDHKRQRYDRFSTFFEHINGASDKMLHMLNELLELSRIGSIVQKSEKHSLKSLLDDTLQLIEGRRKSMGVEVEISEDLPDIYGDHSNLIAVLQNLIDNAMKYMGPQEHPVVRIWGKKNVKGTACYIEDNGIGINPKYQGRIFQLFEK
ncbi:MAG: PAS domain S-box protein, partial [Proteobacteria bacterium]|nr:PAS domain S-box protein [Pseudomonadota bacterium]